MARVDVEEMKDVLDGVHDITGALHVAGFGTGVHDPVPKMYGLLDRVDETLRHRALLDRQRFHSIEGWEVLLEDSRCRRRRDFFNDPSGLRHLNGNEVLDAHLE